MEENISNPLEAPYDYFSFSLTPEGTAILTLSFSFFSLVFIFYFLQFLGTCKISYININICTLYLLCINI